MNQQMPLYLQVWWSFILTGFMVVYALWGWKFYFRPALVRRRFLKGDDALKKIAEHVDLLHDLFGKKVSIRSVSKADGGYDVFLSCPRCERENRLTKGFRGAVCGDCKTPFIKPVIPKQKEGRPN